MKSNNSTNNDNLVKVDWSDLKQVIDTIENRPKQTVPNKGIPMLLRKFTPTEIALRFLKWVSGEELDN